MPGKIVAYGGKSLDQHVADLADHISKRSTPCRIDDAITELKIYDPFARDVIKRTFMATLRPDGANAHLTAQKKWLRGAEKWTTTVDRGKLTTTYAKSTAPMSALSETIDQVSEDLPLEVVNAAQNLITNLNDRANAKLDSRTLAYVAEDVGGMVQTIVTQQREIRVHEKYRHMIEEQMAMMKALVASVTNSKAPASAAGDD